MGLVGAETPNFSLQGSSAALHAVIHSVTSANEDTAMLSSPLIQRSKTGVAMIDMQQVELGRGSTLPNHSSEAVGKLQQMLQIPVPYPLTKMLRADLMHLVTLPA